MSGISVWILSIIGLSVLALIVDLVTEGSKMQPILKGVFAICVMFVIISPLPKIINGDFNFNDSFAEIELNEDFFDYVDKSKIDLLEKSLINALEKEGIHGGEYTINAKMKDKEYLISSISINSENLVFDSDIPNIDKMEYLKQRISELLKIDKGKIIIYER